jgi:hypothetical protein
MKFFSFLTACREMYRKASRASRRALTRALDPGGASPAPTDATPALTGWDPSRVAVGQAWEYADFLDQPEMTLVLIVIAVNVQPTAWGELRSANCVVITSENAGRDGQVVTYSEQLMRRSYRRVA